MKKCLLDIFAFLGANFKELNPKAFGQLFSLIESYFSVWKIALITHKHFNYVLWSMSFDLFHPILQSVERLKIIGWIDHDDPHRTFIIRLSDGFEPLLSGSVPDLHSDLFAVNLNGLNLEINSLNKRLAYQWLSDAKSWNCFSRISARCWSYRHRYLQWWEVWPDSRMMFIYAFLVICPIEILSFYLW